MTKRDYLYSVIQRAKELADMPVPALREFAAGFNTEDTPTRAEVKAQCGGFSRGELVEVVLSEEFDLHTDDSLNEQI